MKYIKQFVYILLFSFLGEILQAIIPLPIPAAIYGIVLLLLALITGIIKTKMVADAAGFLIKNMSLLFIAPVVNILACWELIAPHLLPISIICVVSTALVFAVGGLVTQTILKRKGASKHA